MLIVSRTTLAASIARESFFDFVQMFWPDIVSEKPIWNWHIPYICSELQTLCERVFRRQHKEYDLGINVSPGSTKSIITSEMLPIWCWTRDKTFRIICGSYAQDLSMFLASHSHRLVTSDHFREVFPEIELKKDDVGLMVTKQGGWRFATSTGGAVTGMHAHLQVIDDPINPKDAVSEVVLKSTNDWMDRTLPSRVVDKRITPQVLIMQRLAQDDPTGHRLAKQGGMPFRHICLPASMHLGEVKPRSCRKYYRAHDDLFDPIRLPQTVLDSVLNDQGDYVLAGQYGQRPVPMGGGMFRVDQIQVIGSPPPCRRIIRYWDKAGCLIAGTMVETIAGPKPIESVVEGDLVLTRKGYQEVEWSGQTSVVDELTSILFSDGSIVTGTGDHRVWTENANWIALANLGTGHYVRPLCQDLAIQTSSPSLSMASTIPGNLGAGIILPFAGTRRGRNTLLRDFITAPSPVARISTTRMKTRTTIRLAILNVSPAGNTCSGTGRNSGRQNIEHFCAGFARLLRWVPNASGRKDRGRNTPASSAELHSLAHHLTQTALYSANQNASINIGTTTSGGSADAQPPTPGFPVYDLTVANQPEFYANGILVHNSAGKGAWTVGLKMGLGKDREFILLDVVRGQWEAGARERIIKQTAIMDGKTVEVGVEQEPGSGGKESAQQTLKNLAGFRVRIDRPVGDKAMRADPMAVQLNQGNFKMVRGIWNATYLAELSFFPFSKFKDQVDASSGAFAILTGRRIVVGGL